jgi:hypothetical protein
VGITAVLHKQDLEPVVKKVMQDQLDNYGKIMKEKNLYLSASFTLC